jgi:hypothetical protein
MGLESRRPVRISTEFGFDPEKEMSDDMWSNAISHLLARVINFCFQNDERDSLEGRVSTWRSLAIEVAAWKANRPATFDPFSTAPKSGNPFPSLWLINPWHGEYFRSFNLSQFADIYLSVAGEQYFSLARILLALSEPLPSEFDSGIIDREPSTLQVREEALRVCGLAFTNENVAARVNAFGPLAFCSHHPLKSPKIFLTKIRRSILI